MAKELDFEEGHEFSGPAKTVTFERVLMFCGGPLANMPDWPEVNIHTDRDYARSVGLPDVNASGTQFEGMLAAMLSDVFGAHWYRSGVFDVKFINMVFVGDTITPKVRVLTRRQGDAGVHYAFEVWTENQKGEKTIVGTAECTVTASTVAAS